MSELWGDLPSGPEPTFWELAWIVIKEVILTAGIGVVVLTLCCGGMWILWVTIQNVSFKAWEILGILWVCFMIGGVIRVSLEA